MSLSTVRIWTYKALSADATLYIPSTDLSVMDPYTEADFPRLIQTGGFWGGSGLTTGYALAITDVDNAVEFTSLAVELPKPSFIKQVYFQGQNLAGIYSYVTDSNTLGLDSAFN